MTLLWLIIWFIADSIGDNEPLTADPVNVWTANAHPRRWTRSRETARRSITLVIP